MLSSLYLSFELNQTSMVKWQHELLHFACFVCDRSVFQLQDNNKVQILLVHGAMVEQIPLGRQVVSSSKKTVNSLLLCWMTQRTLPIGGRITVRRVSSLTRLDLPPPPLKYVVIYM